MHSSLPHSNPRSRARNPSEENSFPIIPTDHATFGPAKPGTHAVTKVGGPSSQPSSSTTPMHPSLSSSATVKPTPSTLNRSSSAVFRPASASSKPASAVHTPSRASAQVLVDQLTLERDDLRRKLDATAAGASRLEADLVQERARSAHLASQLERVSTELGNLQRTVTELRGMNATLEGTLAESVEQAEQLWVELERDRGLLAEYQELCNDAVQENDMYRAWLTHLGEDPDDEQRREDMTAIAKGDAGDDHGADQESE